jgi:hypothetical protein
VDVAAQQQAKRAVTKAKTAATKLKNKEAKEARANQVSGDVRSGGHGHASISTNAPAAKWRCEEPSGTN